MTASAADRTSWWALATELLDRFVASGATPPNARAGERFDIWMATAGDADVILRRGDPHEARPSDTVADDLRALVDAAPSPADAAHAIAWHLDERYARTFPDDWIAAAGDASFPLEEGDLYPVLETPWTIFQPYLSRPASLSDPAHDELPHARRFRPTPRQAEKVARVEIHAVHTLLRDAVAGMTAVATAHPNTTWDDLTWEEGSCLWPVEIVDPARQEQLATDLVAAALADGSSLVVLPELCATAGTTDALQALLDEHWDEHEEPALVVAGSRHVTGADGYRRNSAETLIAGIPPRLLHHKLVPFRLPDAIEGLDDPEPTLHLYQDGPFRFAMAICKDLLDQDIWRLLGALGVNLLAAPAMSDKTESFSQSAAGLLQAAQTLTVVANGPLRNSDGDVLRGSSLTARPSTDPPAIREWPPPTPATVAPTLVQHDLRGGDPTVKSLTPR